MIKYANMGISGAGRRLFRFCLAAGAASLASGCIVLESVFTKLEGEPLDINPEDPFELTNRHVFELNSGLDEAAFKPLAISYSKVMPDPVENCIGNIISNIGEPLRLFNHALSLDGQAAVDSYSRFLVNTTMGAFGCVDAADSMGIKKSEIDLGMVARRYEIFDHEPPFLMLPLLGPSTLDEISGSLIGNQIVNPERDRHLVWHRSDDPSHRKRSVYNPYVTTNESNRTARTFITAVHIRSQLLNTTDILDAAALDPYSFQRDAYLQRRRAQAKKLRRKEYSKLLYPYSIFLHGPDAD